MSGERWALAKGGRSGNGAAPMYLTAMTWGADERVRCARIFDSAKAANRCRRLLSFPGMWTAVRLETKEV